MFNELSLNFDLTHSLNLRYFYNCIPIQTDLCQEKIKFKSYMLWFCFCFFNTYKKQLHMKARLRKDQMCFLSSSKSCKKIKLKHQNSPPLLLNMYFFFGGGGIFYFQFQPKKRLPPQIFGHSFRYAREGGLIG